MIKKHTELSVCFFFWLCATPSLLLSGEASEAWP